MSNKGGAPEGNKNARNPKVWQQAIKRALARRANSTVDDGLNELADQFVEAAASGEAWALKELGDRLDGKPSQMIEGTGNDGEIILKITSKEVGVL